MNAAGLGKSARAVDAWVTRFEKPLLLALVLGSVLRFAEPLRQRFDFDEIFTLYLSQLRGFDDLLRAVPADGNPPLYYLLAGLSQRLFGLTEFATRLPAIVAYIVASFCLYGFVRRRGPALAALFALLAFDTAATAVHVINARPYSLLLAFTAIALVSWQRAAEKTSSRWLALACMALGIAGAIASHHFGVFHVGIPLALGEAWRLARHRRLDIPLYAAGAAGAAMLLFTVPLMAGTNGALLAHLSSSFEFYGRPRLADLGAYLDMVDWWLLVAFGMASVLAARFFPEPSSMPSPDPIPAHEVAAAAGLVALVPIVLVLAWTVTGYFQGRYAVGASLGIAILLGFAASGRLRPVRGGAVTVLLCVAMFAVAPLAQEAREAVALLRGRYVAPEILEPAGLMHLSPPPGQPIVVASADEYPALWWYSPPERRARLHYLSDLSFGVRQRDPLAELTLVAEQPFVPSKVDDYAAFLSAHRRFFLYCTIKAGVECDPGTDWIRSRLLAEGHALTVVLRTDKDLLFQVTLK